MTSLIFLFTDIEGSTAPWERDRELMATTFARHIALLGTANWSNGGLHFKTIGDAAPAALPTAPSDTL